ncbi:alpha/beta hydrolase [Leuconostoc lactis]|uniref:alpha/beta hydrolase n=1 Tax=Leuconostoc lactis TaxID=1246 RepID=UPI000BABF3D2|nr:alpha/beta hydrolase [Leuconostoc lactis]PAV31761.1 alpha/beta hydrolase [Leuconostoc lactis]
MIKYVNTTINGLTLRGTAHVPEGVIGPVPTVLLFHGFGAVRDEYFCSFVQISRQLAKRGIAAIAFDFSGHGESDGDFIDFTFSNEVYEGTQLVAFVKTLDFVDETRVALLGMSLGSVAASMVAGLVGDAVMGLCLWSPAAVFQDEILENQTLQGKSIATVAEDGYFDFNSMKLGPQFFEDVKTLDIYPTAKQYLGPVKIIHGADDTIAPVSYAQKYVDTYQQPVDLTVVPGADHSWGDVPTRESLFNATLAFFDKLYK